MCSEMSGIRKREQKNHSCKFTAVVLFISEEKKTNASQKTIQGGGESNHYGAGAYPDCLWNTGKYREYGKREEHRNRGEHRDREGHRNRGEHRDHRECRNYRSYGFRECGTTGNGKCHTTDEPVEYTNLQQITLDSTWEYADHSKINTGAAVLYRAPEESGRKGIVIGVNAGHGTVGGSKVKTLCHPDGSAKVTGGSTAAGAMEAAAVSGGMTFQDGTPEREVTLRMAQILRDKLLSSGYDVLMLRDSEDVQLDNVARTVICNNVADCHIALHWDSGDGKNYDKGCFYISVPEALKNMEPVASHWQQHDTLGTDLVEGLREQGATIYGKGHMGIDLTQTSYSTIPSVDMELGNAYSDHSDVILEQLATGLLTGINTYFEQ